MAAISAALRLALVGCQAEENVDIEESTPEETTVTVVETLPRPAVAPGK